MKLETRKKLSLWVCYIPFIVLALVLIAGAGRLWYACKEEVWRQEAIDGGVIVQAEIVRIHDKSRGGSAPPHIFELWYEYIDENGIKYSGVAKDGAMWHAVAESYRGTKVDIYIDGRGNSIAVGRETHYELMVALSILLTIASVCAVGFDIWFIFFKGKKKTKNEKENAQ